MKRVTLRREGRKTEKDVKINEIKIDGEFSRRGHFLTGEELEAPSIASEEIFTNFHNDFSLKEKA